ncbi:CLUMA_CG021212, isoform A [Clunio marinus]|uniref:CLUMA_CG021212, isoform A n=1 Tax=Clunio marinus TaxID=568069 RepID=A0A1J1J8C8_9DIPT|nr:CLUMA_CG021212, isoform A [Clunio marinus]
MRILIPGITFLFLFTTSEAKEVESTIISASFDDYIHQKFDSISISESSSTLIPTVDNAVKYFETTLHSSTSSSVNQKGESDTSLSTESTLSDASSTESNFFSTTNSIVESKNCGNIISKTYNFHLMRIKLANNSHTLHVQEKKISKLEQTIRNLENEIKLQEAKYKAKLKLMTDQNDEYQISTSKVKSELKVAKKLISIEKYSKGLKEKLKEFKVSDETFSIYEKTFVGLNELEELNLRQNLISNISSFAFDTLLNLKVLILSYNNLKKLENELFTVINVIEEFHADHNHLEAINPKIISDFDSAKVINLNDNNCISQHFPNDLTMVELAIQVAKNCWKTSNEKNIT